MALKGKSVSEKNRIQRILQAFQPTERAHLRKLLSQYRAGRCPRWAEQKLVDAGLIGSSSEPETQTADVDSQRALAEALRRHFAGRLSIDPGQQILSHWMRGTPGKGVQAGAPLPPPRCGNRYDVQGWIEWIEKWVLPTHAVNGHAHPEIPREPSIFEKAQEAEAERQIIERNRARRAEEIELGNFIPVQEHIGRLKIIGQVLNQAITDSIEKIMVNTITEAAKVLPIDEQKMAEFRQQIQQACEQAADAQRTALAGALMQATEKQL